MDLIFYGTDGDRANVLADEMRKAETSVQVRHALAYRGEREACSVLWFTPCVPQWAKDKIKAVYGDVCRDMNVKEAVPEKVKLPSYTVGKGPRGKWYLKDGKVLAVGPFETQQAAQAALNAKV